MTNKPQAHGDVHVMIVIGTRPEAIKLAPLVKAAKAHEGVRVTVCNTQQHKDMVDQVFHAFGIHSDVNLNVMSANQTPSDVVSDVIAKMDKVIAEHQPDWVIVQGDTATCFAAGLAAFFRKVKVAHVEAGLRSMDKHNPWPEETNRKMVTAYADHHFAPTKESAMHLLNEGVVGDDITMCGNTVIDALLSMRTLINENQTLHNDLRASFPFVAPDNKGENLLLATVHRRENHGAPLDSICQAFLKLAEDASNRIVFPVHPNPNVRQVVNSMLGGHPRIHLIEPVSYPQMVYLMSRAKLILTDSGGLQEEAPSLNVPVMVLRETSERMEAVNAGVATLVGTNTIDIVQTAQRLLSDKTAYSAMISTKSLFGNGMASQMIVHKIVEIERQKQAKVKLDSMVA